MTEKFSSLQKSHNFRLFLSCCDCFKFTLGGESNCTYELPPPPPFISVAGWTLLLLNSFNQEKQKNDMNKTAYSGQAKVKYF